MYLIYHVLQGRKSVLLCRLRWTWRSQNDSPTGFSVSGTREESRRSGETIPIMSCRAENFHLSGRLESVDRSAGRATEEDARPIEVEATRVSVVVVWLPPKISGNHSSITMDLAQINVCVVLEIIKPLGGDITARGNVRTL